MRTFAFIFGFAFLVLGILGFFPNIIAKYPPFVFKVNFWLNMIHIASGIFGLIVGFLTVNTARLFFQIIGIIYAILSILGFAYGEREILDVLASNKPTTWLHVIIAVAALVIGYGKE